EHRQRVAPLRQQPGVEAAFQAAQRRRQRPQERRGRGGGSGADGAHARPRSCPLISSFPNSVWERLPRNSVSRLRLDGKRSFPKNRSQTEFGNEVRGKSHPAAATTGSGGVSRSATYSLSRRTSA